MKKTLGVQSFRFHGSLEFLKSMRKVMREELSKASDTKRKEKLRRVKGTDLFRRKTLFELLEGSLPSKYVSISVLGELKTPGGVPRIIKAVDKLRYGIRPRKAAKPLSLAATVYANTIWALARYQTRMAIEWLAKELRHPPFVPELIFRLLSALESTPKAKQYVGFEILKRSCDWKSKKEWVRVEWLLRSGRGQMILGPPEKK
jgi:hypothetical protein